MDNPSGQSRSVWYESQDIPHYEPLTRSERTDVCVVGAGIAGLSVAYHLCKAGRKVIVIDEKPVGGGETGRTSAHLASAIDDRFLRIERLHGRAASQLAYQSHAQAITSIEQIARAENIDCDFHRLDGYLFLASGNSSDLIDREFEAAQHAGVDGIERLSELDVNGFSTGACLRFPNQARFQPLKYLIGLCRAIERMGGRIFCGTRVNDVQGGSPVRLTTPDGHEISADAAVAATNVPSPINNWMGIYTKQAPYRTYMIGATIPRGAVHDALYWDTGDPYHYVRVHSVDGTGAQTLLVGGEDHKTGQPGETDEPQRFEKLQHWARAHFPAASEIGFRWSGQVNEPVDGVAFIGRVPTSGQKNVYVATGDSGMGLTHGAMAGILISDLILGRQNPWEKLYDPARKSLRAAGEFAKENLNVTLQYSDLLTPGDVKSADEIPPDSGALIRQGMTKVAVYRAADGQLHAHSALCTHLGCVVQWNKLEKTWDCPCHGSRFDAKGKMLTGPAIDDLPAAELK